MTEKKKETLTEKITRFSSLIVAITALITAVTSLWKAVDKRVEQASYEMLSNSIQDLQKGQMALREQVSDAGVDAEPVIVASVAGGAQGSPEMLCGDDAEAPMAFIGPPVSSAFPIILDAEAPHQGLIASVETPAGGSAGGFGGGAGGSVHGKVSILPAPASAPRMMKMRRNPPTLVAPPKWDAVRERANSL